MPMKQMTLEEARKEARCNKCRRRIRNDPAPSFHARSGVIVAWTCSRCHTAEDRAEIELNAAGIDYDHMTTDAFGRLVAPLKK